MPRLRALALLTCALLAALLVPASAASADPDPDPLSPSVTEVVAAVEALEQVSEIVEDPAATTATDDHGDQAAHATLALRDLALLREALPPAERQRASSYLSRPTANPDRCPDFSCYTTDDVRRLCSAVVCVHYVRRADDRTNGVPTTDRDADRRPDYVEKVLASVTRVHRTYVAAGYRPPVGDGTRGGDDRTDVYLSQIGDQGLYGYCTTDASQVPEHGSTWAYCVLDNDYSSSEFPSHTPTQNMQVTAAHEYFHAVQFGYDVGEDAWFMEATATWVEDEVYDRVNDNVSYLSSGPMGLPGASLDSTRGTFYYGAWIFFRQVSEHLPHSEGGLPTVVRAMWRQADAGDRDAPDLYSMAAVEAALQARGTSLGAEHLRMAAANLHPRRWYDEGRLYPGTRPTSTSLLTSGLAPTRIDFTQNHLASASYRFEPVAIGARGWRLQVDLDLAPELQGSRAMARVLLESGKVRTTLIDLSTAGDFSGSFAFSSRTVKAVELTIANTSSRYNCDLGTGWSCEGRPLDQEVAQSLVVDAVRR